MHLTRGTAIPGPFCWLYFFYVVHFDSASSQGAALLLSLAAHHLLLGLDSSECVLRN